MSTYFSDLIYNSYKLLEKINVFPAACSYGGQRLGGNSHLFAYDTGNGL